MSWSIRATTPRTSWALGEDVVLDVTAVFTGDGEALRPELAGGAPGSPVLEVRRDGVLEEHRTERFDPSRPQPLPSFVASGQPVRGTIHLGEWVSELPAGEYDVTVVLEDARSLPVTFRIEELEALACIVAPIDASGLGRRSVLRTEERGSEARLLLAWPLQDHHGGSHYATQDLGRVAPSAQLALGVLPEGAWDRRTWVVTLEDASLRARFVGGEPFLTVFEPVPLDLERPRLVAALGGALATPPLSLPEHVRWPELHVLLVAGRSLVTMPFRPKGPRILARRELAAELLAATAVALGGDDRLVLVASRESERVIAVHAHAWTDAGVEEGRLLFRAAGSLRSLEAIVEGGRTRVALLAKDGDELTLSEAIVEPSEEELAPPSFVRLRGLPDDLDEPRLRLGPRGTRYLLARRGAEGRHVLLVPGSLEPIALAPGDALADLDFPHPTRARVIVVDREHGVHATPLALARARS